MTTSYVRDRITVLDQDPPRDEPQVKLRVKHAQRGVSVVGKYLRGTKGQESTHDILVYASDVARVRSKVETDHDGIARARSTFEKKRDAWISQRVASDRNGSNDERRARYERQYPGSVEAEYQSANGRGILPLISVEEIRDAAVQRVDATPKR